MKKEESALSRMSLMCSSMKEMTTLCTPVRAYHSLGKRIMSIGRFRSVDVSRTASIVPWNVEFEEEDVSDMLILGSLKINKKQMKQNKENAMNRAPRRERCGKVRTEHERDTSEHITYYEVLRRIKIWEEYIV